MDFSHVKSLSIPQGNVNRILLGTTVLWKKSALPAEYQEVEYIKSSGTQYINLGISGSLSIIAYLDMQFTVTASSSKIVIASSTGAGRWFGMDSSGNYGAGSGASSNINGLLRKEIMVNFTSSDISFTIDGINYSKTTTSSPSTTYTMFAGKRSGSSMSFYASAKLYKATIQQNSETIMELIPCYRKADDVVGLYNIVNNTFLANSGSGVFVAGPDI